MCSGIAPARNKSAATSRQRGVVLVNWNELVSVMMPVSRHMAASRSSGRRACCLNSTSSSAVAAEMMIEVEDARVVKECLMLFVQRAKTTELPGIQGDDQVKVLAVEGVLHSFNAGQE